jgi:hypothetical protein
LPALERDVFRFERVGEVVCAFRRGEAVEQLADGGANGIEVSGRGVAQQMLELGEDLLDRVEVGRVFGQEEQLGSGAADRLANGGSLVVLARLSMTTMSPGRKPGRRGSRPAPPSAG